MKICFLASSASIHSHKWINFFSNLGYEILWISLDSSSIEISKKISYFEFKNTSLINIYKIRSIISKFNPDVLHIHYLGHYALIGLFAGVKCVVTTPWGSDIIEGKKSFLKKLIISQILYKSEMITCDAYHMLEEIKEFNVSSEKINIINFGIDTEKFSYKDTGENKLNEYGEKGDLKVISLRDFEPVYNIENLINSIPLIRSKIKNVHFILLGRGTLKNKITSMIEDMGLNDAVSFIDYIDNADMPYVLSSADILVSTSLSDAGIAGSTAEAMSCEISVVITDSGENDRWVDHGKNGYLVQVSEPEELAKCIITLLENEDLRTNMGKEARKTILKQNDYFAEMKKMQNLYQSLIS